MPAYEDGIHARWAADATLNGLLPEAKLTTGIQSQPGDGDNTSEPERPYAVMTHPGGQERIHSNSDTLVKPRVRIAVYHGADFYGEAKAISDAIMAAFSRSSFDLDDGSTVLNMQATQDPEPVQNADDKSWEFVVDFDLMIRVPV